MAKLAVSLDGGTVTEITLTPEKEFLLGRGSQCDIILPHPKISRQHAQLFFINEKWHCKVVSKYGQIIVNGRTVAELDLEDGMAFSIPPFEMKFHAEEVKKTTSSLKTAAPEDPDDKTDSIGESTKVVAKNLRAILKKLDEDGTVLAETTIGDGTLTAGRSSSCDVIIEDTHASRRHFSIDFDGSRYVLRDLGSANKTYVNGKEISEHALQSGDEIKVGKERLQFELLDPEFENLPALFPQENNMAIGNQGPAVIKYSLQTQVPSTLLAKSFKNFNSTKNAKIKISAIALIVGFIIYSALTGNKSSDHPRNVASQTQVGQSPSTFDRLPPDQKKDIEETYNLALNLYGSGKYDLAAIQISKVLQAVGNYKDAKNVQALCQQAIEIKKQQDESDRQVREQEAVKQKVADILDGCDTLLKAKKYDKIEECVNQTSELDPENERASNLRIAARQALEEYENSKERKAELARKKAQAQKSYASAKKAISEKRYPAALTELQRVEKSYFPDSEGLKEKAKQDITVVKAKMLKESQSLVQEGKSSLDAKEYGDAVKKFNQALVLAPFNSDAKTLKEKASRELHLEMKNMYSEAVIEENLGNIESAKKKWSTILKDDDKGDTYYEKSQIKLRKYEK